MKRKIFPGVFLSVMVFFTLASPLPAAQLSVEVTNLTHGMYFTPLLITEHDNATYLFLGKPYV